MRRLRRADATDRSHERSPQWRLARSLHGCLHHGRGVTARSGTAPASAPKNLRPVACRRWRSAELYQYAGALQAEAGGDGIAQERQRWVSPRTGPVAGEPIAHGEAEKPTCRGFVQAMRSAVWKLDSRRTSQGCGQSPAPAPARSIVLRLRWICQAASIIRNHILGVRNKAGLMKQ